MAISAGIMAATTVAKAGYDVYAGNKAAKEQKKADQLANDAREKDRLLREQELNKQEAKKPTMIDTLMMANLKKQKAVGSTNLTGPSGVNDPLALGRTAALGA